MSRTVYDDLSDEDRARIVAADERYLAAGHAVQTGIAMTMNYDPTLTQPKHMRVGVDLSRSDQLGLVVLLVRRGVITWPEYFEAIADAAEEEKTRWERHLEKILGSEVTLR